MLKLNGIELEFSQFANGETKMVERSIDIAFVQNVQNYLILKYKDDSDLIKLLFVKKYLDLKKAYVHLTITFMPYSQMDRSENGSAVTLKYTADFINDMMFDEIVVIEPHSDMTIGLLEAATPRFITHDLLPIVINEVEFNIDSDYLFFPDAGAQKRYGKIWPGVKQLVGYKVRDFVTGEIKSLEVVGELPKSPNLHKIIIVDDLCMRGGTFFESGKKLKTLGFNEVHLVVAHCLNTVYEGELLKDDSPIKKIFTTNTVIDSSTHANLNVFDWERL